MHAVLRGNACHCATSVVLAFKRLNRFVRFVIGVVRSEIIDLTEYQDTTIGVVMSCHTPFRRHAAHPLAGQPVQRMQRTMLPQVGIVYQHRQQGIAAAGSMNPREGVGARRNRRGATRCEIPTSVHLARFVLCVAAKPGRALQ